jgi:predicted secreted protein
MRLNNRKVFSGGKKMRKFTQLLTVMTAINLLLTACAEAASSAGGKTIIVTPAVRGNSASLNVGDSLEIQIPTIPKEGFEWEAQDLDTTILVQEGSAVYTADSDPNSAGGIVTLRFTAVGAGTINLTLLFMNAASSEGLSWSKDSFGMSVEVK